MKVTLKVTLDGYGPVSMEYPVKKFADLRGFGRNLEKAVKEICRVLPEMGQKPVGSITLAKE